MVLFNNKHIISCKSRLVSVIPKTRILIRFTTFRYDQFRIRVRQHFGTDKVQTRELIDNNLVAKVRKCNFEGHWCYRVRRPLFKRMRRLLHDPFLIFPAISTGEGWVAAPPGSPGVPALPLQAGLEQVRMLQPVVESVQLRAGPSTHPTNEHNWNFTIVKQTSLLQR
jgi:hypothetical protein